MPRWISSLRNRQHEVVRGYFRGGYRWSKLCILRGIRAIKYSQWLNRRYPKFKDRALWRGDRHSFARAGLIGAFCAFTPIPFQMPLAAFVAYHARAHIPLSVALAWITNPLTMGPIWATGYWVGTRLIGAPVLEVVPGGGAESLVAVLPQIWAPLLLGNWVLGALVGGCLYLGIHGVHQMRRRSH